MNIPSKADPRWVGLFLKSSGQKFEFLATNMVYTRLVIEAKRDDSEQNLRKLAGELWNVFATNAHNPKVQNDIKRIFG